MSSSVPCQTAYDLSSAAISVFCVSAIIGAITFVLYFIQLHKNPDFKPVTTKYDIESASWVLILSIISGMASSVATVMNYLCGPSCAEATLQCNTQMGTASMALVTAISIMSAGIMKLLSFYTQTKHPVNQ